MPNIIASNPTDDSFEEILSKADHQIQGMSITNPKQVRFTDRERREMTSTPKRPEMHGPQDPEDISLIPRGEDVQLGRQHHLAYLEGLKNSLQLAATVPQNIGPKNHKTERGILPWHVPLGGAILPRIDWSSHHSIPVWWDRKLSHWRILQLLEDAFADELQIPVRKIIARKPEFHLQAN